jgi:hypothetical protein
MYPYRDPITELYGYADGKKWIVAPAFYYAYNVTHQRAIVQKSEGEYGCLNQKLEFVSLDSIVAPLLKNARIKQVSNLNENPAETFAWYLIVEHGREVSFILLDHELKPTILKTISNKVGYQFYSDCGWLLLRLRESGKWKYFSFHPQTLEQQSLPDFKNYAVSKDGHWVVAAINERDDPKSDFITIGDSDRFAFFSVESLERISDWYPGARPFSEGLGLVRDSQDRFVDSELKPVKELVFDYAEPFRQGLTPACRENESGYFAKDGKLVIPTDLEYELRSFDRLGHAVLVTPNQDRMLINRQGTALLSNLQSCDFFDGDYPYYEITYEEHDGNENLYLKPDLSKAITVIY